MTVHNPSSLVTDPHTITLIACAVALIVTILIVRSVVDKQDGMRFFVGIFLFFFIGSIFTLAGALYTGEVWFGGNKNTTEIPVNIPDHEADQLAHKFGLSRVSDQSAKPRIIYAPSKVKDAKFALTTHRSDQGISVLRNSSGEKLYCVYIGHVAKTTKGYFDDVIREVDVTQAICSDPTTERTLTFNPK